MQAAERQTFELAGLAQWIRVIRYQDGSIEVRALRADGQDLMVLSTAGGRLMVRLVEPHRSGDGIWTSRR